MNKDMLMALRGLGYREIAQNKWAKPVGLTLWTYEVETSKWSCLFIGVDNEPHVWDSDIYNEKKDTNFKHFMTKCEAWLSRTSIGSGTDMAFLTMKEIMEFALG